MVLGGRSPRRFEPSGKLRPGEEGADRAWGEGPGSRAETRLRQLLQMVLEYRAPGGRMTSGVTRRWWKLGDTLVPHTAVLRAPTPSPAFP